MIARHIHHALAQVRELQQKVLEKQRFKGYSGRARAMAGTVALLGAMLMSGALYPESVSAHVIGWGVVFVIGVLLNYGALFYWFFQEPHDRRDLRRLKPALDVFPPLFVGGVLTAVTIRSGQHLVLPGLWMCLYGCANLASRKVLPRMIGLVGWYYIACGTAILLIPTLSFTNPWPMAIVFFCGEWAGGFILHFDRSTNTSISAFLFDFIFKVRREGQNT